MQRLPQNKVKADIDAKMKEVIMGFTGKKKKRFLVLLFLNS